MEWHPGLACEQLKMWHAPIVHIDSLFDSSDCTPDTEINLIYVQKLVIATCHRRQPWAQVNEIQSVLDITKVLVRITNHELRQNHRTT